MPSGIVRASLLFATCFAVAHGGVLLVEGGGAWGGSAGAEVVVNALIAALAFGGTAAIVVRRTGEAPPVALAIAAGVLAPPVGAWLVVPGLVALVDTGAVPAPLAVPLLLLGWQTLPTVAFALGGVAAGRRWQRRAGARG